MNATETESLEDESWTVIVKINKTPSAREHSALTASIAPTKPESELYDSGASRYMSPFWHRFINLVSIPPHPITATNNCVFYGTSLGDIKIDIPNGSLSTPITLKDALYAPNMTLTVISVSKIRSGSWDCILKCWDLVNAAWREILLSPTLGWHIDTLHTSTSIPLTIYLPCQSCWRTNEE